jgi:hypothetical protein
VEIRYRSAVNDKSCTELTLRVVTGPSVIFKGFMCLSNSYTPLALIELANESAELFSYIVIADIPELDQVLALVPDSVVSWPMPYILFFN